VTSATSVSPFGGSVRADSYRGAKSRGRVRITQRVGARGGAFLRSVGALRVSIRDTRIATIRAVAIERAICSRSGSKTNFRSVERLANRQHGVVSRPQLIGIGLGYRGVDHWIARGLLHPIHRGVYAVGRRRVTRSGDWMAAILAAGPGAVLSHRSAAALWGLRRTTRTTVDVTAPRLCRRAGIESHRTELPPDEVTIEDGIPVTTAARTLFDLAAVVSAPQIHHALNEAEIRRLTGPVSLDDLIARHPRRPGMQALKQALDLQRQRGETVIRSVFETEFLDFVDRFGLERPRMNEPLADYLPDAVWPAARLVVELDSYDIHATRQTFESDRERDRKLQLLGYRVIRITWRQLTTDPQRLARELRSLTADPHRR
jgi:very-short-patch-repair endonuclease